MSDIEEIHAQCGYGAATRLPFVTVTVVGGQRSLLGVCQMSPAQARAVALQILGAADAAESDAAVFAILGEEVAPRLIVAMRAERAKHPIIDTTGDTTDG